MLVVIDLMAFIRKLSLRKMKIKTYGELAGTLRDRLIQTAGTCFRIDIIFDVYRRFSIHITDGYKCGLNSVLVVSPDTDVFVCLLSYHQNTWQLDELNMKPGSGATRTTVPLHLFCRAIESGTCRMPASNSCLWVVVIQPPKLDQSWHAFVNL